MSTFANTKRMYVLLLIKLPSMLTRDTHVTTAWPNFARVELRVTHSSHFKICAYSSPIRV